MNCLQWNGCAPVREVQVSDDFTQRRDPGNELDRPEPVVPDDNAPAGSQPSAPGDLPGADAGWRAPASQASQPAGGGALVNGERKERRGFASMSPEKQREIASKGGRAAHQKGTAHEWTSDEARSAGRKGGQVSRGGRGRLVVPAESGAATADMPASAVSERAAAEVGRGE